MKFRHLLENRRKHKSNHTLQCYMIISYAIGFIGTVLADVTIGHLESAETFLSSGKYNDALPHFHEAINNDPNNYLTYFKRATVFLALNRPNSALDDLNRALELNPKFTSALSQRAHLHVKMGNLDEAHIDYEQNLRLEPGNAEVAMLQNRVEQLKEGVMNVQDLLEDRQYDIALRTLEPIMENMPFSIELLKLRATAFEQVGELRRAISDYSTIVNLRVDAATHLTIAKLSFDLGEFEESMNNVIECLKLEPEHKSCMEFYKTTKKSTSQLSDVLNYQSPSNMTATKPRRSKNYASSECAKVIESNPESKKSSNIINEMTDEYMLNPCKAKIWFVIELCEIIEATQIELANYELYSSTPKEFTVYFSDAYPAPDWKPIGHFTATDSRSLQTFDLNQVGFGKYIRVELNSHYGNEHYCVISEVKVFGASMVDDFEKSQKRPDDKNEEAIGDNNLRRKSRKNRKTSAYRVYRNMMINSQDVCGLSHILEGPNALINNQTSINSSFGPGLEPIPKPILPQPSRKPNVTITTPLKPSIFVELGNKLKALEVSLKSKIEEMEKRLMDRSEFEIPVRKV